MITAETDAGARFAAFGAGSMIAFPPGAIFGERWIEVGERTLIGEQVSVSAGIMPGHDLGQEPVLRIGDGCVIGRGSHLVAHLSIDIGDDVYTGPYVYITDQNHSYADPEVPVGRQWPVNSAVRIGDGCWLGTGAIVLPGSALGRNVVVAAGSVVRGEFGDHCVIAGVPARVIKRFDPAAGWTRPQPEPRAALMEAGSKDLVTVDGGADAILREALESVAQAMTADPLLASAPLTGLTALPAGGQPGDHTVAPTPGLPASPDAGVLAAGDSAVADSRPHPEPAPGP